jgi:hypothetical protein
MPAIQALCFRYINAPRPTDVAELRTTPVAIDGRENREIIRFQFKDPTGKEYTFIVDF